MGKRRAAEHVAAADHDGYLDAETQGIPDLPGDMRHHVRVYAKPGTASECLAGQLEYHPVPTWTLAVTFIVGLDRVMRGHRASTAADHSTVPRIGAIWQNGLPRTTSVSTSLPYLEPGKAAHRRARLGEQLFDRLLLVSHGWL